MKVGFLAHGPGSANALYPLIKEFPPNIEIKLYSFHPYVSNLWGCKQLEMDNYLNIFKEDLDILFYGTGSGHDMEINAPLYARKHHIKTISVLDIFWMKENNLKQRFPVLPDYIIVPNASVKQTLLDLKIGKKENVLVLGNPHFDRLETLHVEQPTIPLPFDIVLFSQPSTSDYFSETGKVVQQLILDVIEYKKENPNHIRDIYVSPHPRESLEWLERLASREKIRIEKDKTSFDLLLSCDLNAGVDCTLQYESLIIGKPTIFYSNRENLFKDLYRLDKDFIFDASIYTNFHATKNIINWFCQTFK